MPKYDPDTLMLCDLCRPPRWLATEAMIDHCHYVHNHVPDFECWPDGEDVVVDDLEPSDFTGGV